MEIFRIPPVSDMPDETLIKHLENRHPAGLRVKFKPLPGQKERRLAEPIAWRVYHDTIHKLATDRGETLDHFHGTEGDEPPLAIEA